MRKPEKVRVLVGAAVFALVAAACGSSKGTTAATTAAYRPPRTAAQRPRGGYGGTTAATAETTAPAQGLRRLSKCRRATTPLALARRQDRHHIDAKRSLAAFGPSRRQRSISTPKARWRRR